MCGNPADEEHHVFFGTANRKLSEKYGLVSDLCNRCHRNGEKAVHKCREIDLELKRKYQRKFEREHPDLSFIAIFGRNYIW